MKTEDVIIKIKNCEKLLIVLGEEWRTDPHDKEKTKRVADAYGILQKITAGKDFFLVTMAYDALIFESPLATAKDLVPVSGGEEISCSEEKFKGLDPAARKRLEELFPEKKDASEPRMSRIAAPCGNATWQQCSKACTKDIWEPGEIPSGICPHCGAPLVGNTIEAEGFIEEGSLLQWDKYLKWLSQSFGKDTLVLELGLGMQDVSRMRLPLENTILFHRDAFLVRVNKSFPFVPEEIAEKSESIRSDSIAWVLGLLSGAGCGESRRV